jgi:hypothetical protein
VIFVELFQIQFLKLVTCPKPKIQGPNAFVSALGLNWDSVYVPSSNGHRQLIRFGDPISLAQLARTPSYEESAAAAAQPFFPCTATAPMFVVFQIIKRISDVHLWT